ncbi:MAG: O-antigen ligase family protein [Bacteroidetes bacterium]|nr:O-antigen ligase family protein [Bacteroidota bacterium]
MTSLLNKNLNLTIYAGIALLTLASLFYGAFTEKFFLFAIPFVLLFAYFCITDFKKVYLALMFFIPFSAEIQFTNGFATDLPAEPIIVSLMLVFFLFIITKKQIDFEFIKHPIIQMLFIHLAWVLVAVFFSSTVLISVKFLLAKIWYVTVFVFLTLLLIKEAKDFKAVFWVIFIPMSYTLCLTIFKHGLEGFAFDKINDSLRPFYRNHVNYAAFVSLFLPFVWIAANWYEKGSFLRYLLIAARYLFLTALVLSYTRGAILAVILSLVVLFIIERKLLKWGIFLGLAASIFVGGYLIKDQKYLDYAPEYESTVYHGQLKDHLKATTQANDISSVERIYRWIAGVRMSMDKPLTGFGPNNFYHFYKGYSVSSFSTYVSDNPEKSGAHNYFLLLVTEQGYPALLIFLMLTIVIFHYIIKLYKSYKHKLQKEFAMAIFLSMIIIYTQLCLSDLVEALKIGAFFFINIALIVNLSNGHLRFSELKHSADALPEDDSQFPPT